MTETVCSFRLNVNDRFCLTEIRSTDTPAFIEHLNEREIFDRTLRIPFPYAQADAEKFLAVVEETTARHGHPVLFAIRDERDRLIGSLGFDEIRYGHRAEIGYWLAKPYWGQGIMTPVVGVACQFAMTEWKLVRIVAHVFDFNRASARVLEKNGFVLEGHLRKHIWKHDHFQDEWLYALVR